jgi:iron(III) transport system ATP-binding protein
MVSLAQPKYAGGESELEPLSVRVTGLGKSFRRANGTTIRPVDDISLDVKKGEFVVLLGPSGCGKTTLLRCVAGLEKPDSGRIEVHGRPVFDSQQRTDIPPEHRKLGMIFQSYALWPHLSVRHNVAYPLKAAKVARADIAPRVEAALRTVGVLDVIDQMPGKLSGGQQQRVALARALVAEPELVLFDEPLSNVDAKVREELRVELIQMQHRIGFSALYVTHDQAEAMELADTIAVLGNGRIEQLDTPSEVYRRPANHYVGGFVGTTNEVRGTVRIGAEQVIETDFGAIDTPAPAGASDGSGVRVIWRPESTRVVEAGAPTAPGLRIAATVVVSRFMGPTSELLCRTEFGTDVRVLLSGEPIQAAGERISLSVACADLIVFPV